MATVSSAGATNAGAADFGQRLVALGGAAARRIELLRRPAPASAHGPTVRRFLGELGHVAESVAQRFSEFEVTPAPHPRQVMLLPGFGTHPLRMRYMAQQLEKAGHTAKRWGLGFNFGPTQENFEFLTRRLVDIHERSGEKVVLVGWSLGGVFARELAKLHPDAVAKVVTMGSPFSGNPHANNVWRIYEMITGHSVDDPPVVGNLREKPLVETVALWSPRDGIVHPRAACGRPGERDRAVALRCSHLGFADSHECIRAVLRELDPD
jgi:pimeloyl-ACP methyl ester carboxylesterase